MKRDTPLSATPNPSSYTGGEPFVSQKVKVYNGDGKEMTSKYKTYKNIAGDTVTKTKKLMGNDENGKKIVYKSKTVTDDKTGIDSKRKTKLNREIPQVSDLQDLRKGKSKTNYDRTTGDATSRKQKDSDLKVGYADTGMMAKTNNYSKDRAKEVLKSVGTGVKTAVKAVKEERGWTKKK